MIGSFTVLNGYASKLERLKSPIEFQPGLNILFGENGCGKSTVLKICAAYCSIEGGGWSRHHRPFIRGKYPEVYKEHSPGKCEALVQWDGTPTLFADSTITDQTNFSYFFDEKMDSPDGMSDMTDQLSIMKGHLSSGMMRILKFKKYVDSLKNPPNILKISKEWKSYNDVWTDGAKKQIEYFESLPRHGPVTFMMDEPDRSLSIENQLFFWENFIPRFADKYQMIVATHCPFALLHAGATWIEFNEKYRAKSMAALQKLKSVL